MPCAPPKGEAAHGTADSGQADVSAILLTWFPGQEGGPALADVLTGVHEPGGRLPTTWGSLADAPVTAVVPESGRLTYTEDTFIGYRAWERAGAEPSYAFGHGLGHTDWAYESIEADASGVTVSVRNTGSRPGREMVQIYAAPAEADSGRPARWLAGFATAEAAPGGRVTVTVDLPRRTFEIWDEATGSWTVVKGGYEIQAGRSIADCRLVTTVEVAG